MTRSEGPEAIVLRRNGLTVTAPRRVPDDVLDEIIVLVAKAIEQLRRM